MKKDWYHFVYLGSIILISGFVVWLTFWLILPMRTAIDILTQDSYQVRQYRVGKVIEKLEASIGFLSTDSLYGTCWAINFEGKKLILTANHTLRFIDGSKAYVNFHQTKKELKIIAVDSTIDVAILAFKDKRFTNCPTIPLAMIDSATLPKSGDNIISVGYSSYHNIPLLSSRGTINQVAVTKPTIYIESQLVILSDVNGPPGGSGGVLTNENGEAIGLNIATSTDSEGRIVISQPIYKIIVFLENSREKIDKYFQKN